MAQMLNMAEEMGFVCMAYTEFKVDLAASIASRMVHRSGMAVYQSVNFTMERFPRAAALHIIGTDLLDTPWSKLHWKLETVESTSLLMDNLMATLPSASYCKGMCRALMSASEPTALVIAILMPTLELKWESTPRGGHLKVNFMYCLADASGELHPPKDDARRELKLPPPLEAGLRQRILHDVTRMIALEVPLASGWYRQVGMLEKATVVAACEAGGRKPPKAQKPKPTPKLKKREEVKCIIKEVKTNGKAKIWFLVEWEGYARAPPP